jgi:hypothetical protein
VNEHQIRIEIHRILDSHNDLLASVRSANGAMAEAHVAMQLAHSAMRQSFEAHDALLVSAIDANRAALRLLNRVMDEGVDNGGGEGA